jgi:hypothetical protein
LARAAAWFAVAAPALLAGCAAVPRPEDPTAVMVGHKALFHAATAIQDEWQHLPMRGETEYRLAALDGKVAIRAVGRHSASGLLRRVSVDPAVCPVIEWSWYAAEIQSAADLRVKEREDVAASVFLFFGDPGFMVDPKPVPTLRYVWTNRRVPVGAVIDNPYLPGIVRSIVVQSGRPHLGKWVTERRNVAADFRQAFGYEPTERIHAIALFTDNDQTKEPAVAYYGWARMACTD